MPDALKYDRVYNFSAGPCCLPDEVLETARDQMMNHEGSGMGVMEMSHRSKEFMAIAAQAEKDSKDVLGIPANYKFMFVQGGATLQFASVPLNLFPSAEAKADYFTTGQWSEKAVKEAKKYGVANEVVNTKSTKFTTIPEKSEWKLDSSASYAHYCDNETVNGVEFQAPPDVGSVPLVADMSSNFMSRPINVEKHAAIYAGAQKNLGPAGNCVVIVKEDFLGKEMKICPTYMNWAECAKADSMYNTPNCYGIYMIGLSLKYTKEKGGLAYWEEQSKKKSGLLYDTIDKSDGFYKCPVDKSCRSRMNVPFVIQGGNEELEKKFQADAKKEKLFTLAGHRSVGGLRASLYNGMPMAGVETLTTFMKAFQEENQK